MNHMCDWFDFLMVEDNCVLPRHSGVGFRFGLLFVVGTASVFPTLFGTFLFDDTEAIAKNAVVVKPEKEPLSKVFTHDFWGVELTHPLSHKSYRPLTTLTYRAQFLLWGSGPFSFHFVNLIIHGLNCGLVYVFLRRLLEGSNACWENKASVKRDDVAFWSSLLFSVHPVHVEPVGGVVGRADLLAAFVFICGFIRVCRLRGHFGLYCSVFLSIVGSLFKENGIIFTLFLVTFEIAGSRKYLVDRKRMVTYVIVIGLTGLFVLLRLYCQNGSPVFQTFDNPPAFAPTAFSKVFSVMYVWFLNTVILACPIWLCYDWSGDCVALVKSMTDWRFAVILISLLLWSGILWRARTNRLLRIACLLFCVTFLPSSNLLLTVGFVIAERNLYLPSIGFCLLVAYAFLQHTKGKLILYYLVAIFFFRSIQRSYDWMDQGSLFTSAIKVCPGNAKVHYNLGKLYTGEGKSDMAVQAYKHAISLRSDYYQAMNNLGNLLRHSDLNESEHWLQQAVELKPDFAAAWMNLGIVLSRKNHTAALHCYERALRFRQNYADCYYNKGNIHLEMGNKSEALHAWTRAITINPQHSQSWINMVILLDQEEQLNEARDTGLQALELIPGSDTLHFLLGNVLGKLAQFETAETYFQSAIFLAKQTAKTIPAKYYSNLGVLYHRWGRKEQAGAMYREALAVDPTSKSVQENLARLKL